MPSSYLKKMFSDIKLPRCKCECHGCGASAAAPEARGASPALSDDGQASPAKTMMAESHVASPWASQPTSARSAASSSESPCVACASTCATPSRPFVGKTVVLLRTSSTARAPVYRALRQKGLRIVMVHPFANTEQFPAECIDEWIECDTTDVDRLYEILSAEPYAGNFDAVASFDEYGVFPAAQLNQRFGLRPLPLTPAALSTVNIKSRFRHWCVKRGVAAPRFAPLMTPEADPVAAVEEAKMNYPIVVKPAPGAGSNLVTLVDDAAGLRATVERLWGAIEAMRPTAAHFEALGERIHVLLEEFVEGPEVDVDAIVEDGAVRFAGVSDNFPTARPYFSEVGGLAPSALAAPIQDDLTKLLEDFVAAMRDDGERLHGVLHFEAKYDERRGVAVVIEVNCRMGSAETHTMVTSGFGVDLAEAAMRLALRMPLQPLPRVHEPGRAARGTGVYAASANLYPTKAGPLVEIVPPPAQPHLVRAMPFPMARGAPVKLPPESFGCLLWLVATGPSADVAVARMKAMCDQSAIVVEGADN